MSLPHPSLHRATLHLPAAITPPPRKQSPPNYHHTFLRRTQSQQLHHQRQPQDPGPPHEHPQPTKKATLRSRLSQLCKDGRLDAARRLLFQSLSHPAASPTLLWNTLIIGYVCNDLPLEALRLYALMNSPSDAYTYSSALKACADARQLRLGKSIHCRIVRLHPSPQTNRVLNNSLLNMYACAMDAETSRVDAVRLVFDRMPKRNVVAWNTLIAWYVRRRCSDEALALLRLMLEVRIRPTPVTFVNVFPAVSAIGEIRICDVLYGLLVKCGHGHLNDPFVASAAILMYSELSSIESARWIFDQAEGKNTQVWNTMISGYVQNGDYSKALALLIEILESSSVGADTVTFLSSLIAVSQMQDLQLGQQIHAYLIKENPGKVLPLVLSNALIVMYSRCGEVQIAFDVFEQMPERDVVTWNTIVSALVQNDLNLEGVLLVYEMQKQGFVVDSVTAVALLSAASNLGNFSIGKEMHGYLIRHNIQFDGMESYLIDMYAKSGSVEIACRLFNSERSDNRDRVTWNAMIAGYTQNGQSEEALAVFRNMLQESQIPNAVPLTSILPACSPVGVGGILAGKEMHGFAIRYCLDDNVFVATALIDMYSRCGEICSAERIFDGMGNKNTVTYTTMLSAFGQHGLGEKSVALFQLMKELGVKPDAVTFVALISACSYSGLIEEGLAVFESMKDFGITATTEHHCCVVDLLGRAGRVEEAYEFAKGLGETGKFTAIWGSLLAACRVHGKFELGELVAEKLFELGKEEELAGYHVLLSNVYASDRNWDSADKVRKDMRERGMRKEPGSSWIEVADSLHRFMSKDQMHPKNDQIYGMLQGLDLEMKSPGYKIPELQLDDIGDVD
ncbi:pentatricopeptide repeat-containing protein At3g22150, chloroplastic [Curcuma longa]|uniref:pentatricopeptide repeat-containing protein At3g22150, chloroplastic n=1 Tax=Curcuma longa TaxID=136217 RepID=UPI003D9DB1B9